MSGFVHITAAKEKTIEGLSVTLIGHRKAYLPSNGGSAEETDILKREVVLGGSEPGGRGIHLNSGLNRYVDLIRSALIGMERYSSVGLVC